MGNPIYYVAHDPLGNTEQQVAEFDPALLAEAERAGIIFIAVDAGGSRTIVPACDVAAPQSHEGSISLVQPVYVDDRMDAVLGVFDALQAVVFPEAVATVATEAPAAASAADPAQNFRDKLEALRQITLAGDSR